MKKTLSTAIAVAAGMTLAVAAEPVFSLTGDWNLKVSLSPALEQTFAIDPAPIVKVVDEKVANFPDYNPKGWEFNKGYKLNGLRAQECTIKYALDPATLKITDAPGGTAYELGKDYQSELSWGAVGRLADGAIKDKQTVYISYSYGPQRIDSIVLSADGKKLLLKKGTPDVAMPKVPALAAGERAILNVFVTPRLAKLSDANLFPVTETAYPESLAASSKGIAEKLLPKTMAKLRNGEKLRILAWGDSVTDGGFLPEKEKNRWQAQFVTRLKARFPKADIELLTQAWGGHNTDNYFAAPAGDIHNYQEKVLALKPDLIITEFINDKGFSAEKTNERYSKILADFKGIGAEWIINTPHYDLPEWRKLKSQKDIDEDPNLYVKTLREFAAKNNIPLSDVSARYGRLWRQGIPYMTLMSNAINHPGPDGMKIFADSLINLFPEK